MVRKYGAMRRIVRNLEYITWGDAESFVFRSLDHFRRPDSRWEFEPDKVASGYGPGLRYGDTQRH
jgi:hypothetical protein